MDAIENNETKLLGTSTSISNSTTPTILVMSMNIVDRLDIMEDSLKVIEEKNKKPITTTTNTYYNGYNSMSDNRSIYFYEFSNTSNKPLIFSKVSSFIDWAKEHGIIMSTYMENQLKANPCSYCTCREGGTTIIRASSKYALDGLMSGNYDYYKPTQVSTYERYPYGDDWDGYDWD